MTRHVDIIACGEKLNQLLGFIPGADKAFLMHVELIDDGVCIGRRETTPHERLSDARWYGHSFLEACTTWDIEIKAPI